MIQFNLFSLTLDYKYHNIILFRETYIKQHLIALMIFEIWLKFVEDIYFKGGFSNTYIFREFRPTS